MRFIPMIIICGLAVLFVVAIETKIDREVESIEVRVAELERVQDLIVNPKTAADVYLECKSRYLERDPTLEDYAFDRCKHLLGE